MVVCFVLVRKGKALLMEKRIKPEYQFGKWTFPWSSVNEGENPDAAASRILKEQLGFQSNPKLKEVLHLYEGFPWKAEHAAKDYAFIYEVEGPTNMQASPDISEANYMEPHAIIKDQDLHHFHRDIANALGIGWKPLGITQERAPPP